MRQHKIREKMTRQEAAETMRRYAGFIEQGRVEGGEMIARVPNNVQIKIEIESDELEFRVRWGPTLP